MALRIFSQAPVLARGACGETNFLFDYSLWQHYIQLFSQVFFEEHAEAVSVMLSLMSAFQIVPSVLWNAGAIARPGKAPLDTLISKWQTAQAERCYHNTVDTWKMHCTVWHGFDSQSCITRINWRVEWRRKYGIIKDSIVPRWKTTFLNTREGVFFFLSAEFFYT